MKILYFIALEIPSPLKEEIIELKEGFVEKYDSKHALRTPPHVTLQMPIRIEVENEISLVKKLKRSLRAQVSGKLQFKGISSFPPRVIFIDVEKSEWLSAIHQKVQKALSELEFLNHQAAKDFHPHVTLMTRDLKRQVYKKAFEDLKDLEFDQLVDAGSVTLFKHDGKRWNALEVYTLN